MNTRRVTQFSIISGGLVLAAIYAAPTNAFAAQSYVVAPINVAKISTHGLPSAKVELNEIEFMKTANSQSPKRKKRRSKKKAAPDGTVTPLFDSGLVVRG